MPCRDDYYDDHYQQRNKEANERMVRNLQKRNDELAAENCALRAFICSTYTSIDTSKLSKHHTEIFKKAIKEQKIHRGKDKKRAIKSISKEIDSRKDRIAKIKQLGGIASDGLVEEIKEYQDKLAAIKKSDPMNTSLY